MVPREQISRQKDYLQRKDAISSSAGGTITEFQGQLQMANVAPHDMFVTRREKTHRKIEQIPSFNHELSAGWTNTNT